MNHPTNSWCYLALVDSRGVQVGILVAHADEVEHYVGRDRRLMSLPNTEPLARPTFFDLISKLSNVLGQSRDTLRELYNGFKDLVSDWYASNQFPHVQRALERQPIDV